MGAARPFFMTRGKSLTDVYTRERTLQREIEQRVQSALPGVEVLALELVSPARFCVYVDHPAGVDHALCERVTNVLRGYLDRYSVDVSSPGLDRPLRKPAHFADAVGSEVTLRTSEELNGRKRFRGQVVSAGERAVTVALNGDESVEIPYEAIVRGNVVATSESGWVR
jgi:ribosome maturation factor RimP